MKIAIISFLFCVGGGLSRAQNITDIGFNSDFAAQVKSIDEFICRFNGAETKPGLEKDSQGASNNLLSLFDFQMSHNNLTDNEFRQLLMSFVNSAIDNDTKLNITNAKIWAKVNTSAIINGKKENINLYMQSEVYKDSLVRWAIVNVDGLETAGIIDTTNYYAISPVEHEINFPSIREIFHNRRPTEIMGYRGKYIPIDELSVFFAYSMLNRVRIDMINKVTIYCLDVPDFVFTLNEFEREGDNSGWLISSIMPIKESDKQLYIKSILGR